MAGLERLLPDKRGITRSLTVPLVLVLSLFFILAGCHGEPSPASRVATVVAKSAPRQNQATDVLRIASTGERKHLILRELHAQLLEAHGYVVERRSGFDSTREIHEAIVQDEIDLYLADLGTDRPESTERLQDGEAAAPLLQPAPVIRRPVLERHPEIAKILDPLIAQVTDEVMAELLARVNGPAGMAPEEVAHHFLAESGLLDMPSIN